MRNPLNEASSTMRTSERQSELKRQISEALVSREEKLLSVLEVQWVQLLVKNLVDQLNYV